MKQVISLYGGRKCNYLKHEIIFIQHQQCRCIPMRIVLKLHDYFITTLFPFPFNCFCKKFYKRIKVQNGIDEIDKKIYKIVVTANVCQLVQQYSLNLFYR